MYAYNKRMPEGGGEDDKQIREAFHFFVMKYSILFIVYYLIFMYTYNKRLKG